MYRLANSAKVSADLANTAYAAFELLGNVNGAMLSNDDARKLAKTRDDLMTYAAGAYVPKVPAEVLETLRWCVEMGQARATENDFPTAREALAEHDALSFATDWLEASGVDVSDIRGAELTGEAREALEAEAAADQAKLDALERAALDADPSEAIRDALSYLGGASSESITGEVLDALETAGFVIVPAPKA